MRVLFDQATPVPILPYLKGHEVRTAAQQGWDTPKNGELLGAAEADGFDVSLTTDKNMRHQQNLAGRKIAVATQKSTYPWGREAVVRNAEVKHRGVISTTTDFHTPTGHLTLPRFQQYRILA